MTLKRWLETSGKTQEWLSEHTGIQQPLISKYVRGVQRPHIDNAVAIEKATDRGVPVEEWVGWAPTTKSKRKRAA